MGRMQVPGNLDVSTDGRLRLAFIVAARRVLLLPLACRT